MSEWKLYGNKVPVWTAPWFFKNHPWIDPLNQTGHAERTDMVADLVAEIVKMADFLTLTDLGCGDGALLQKIQARCPNLKAWGYELGMQNVHVGRDIRWMDVREADFLSDPLEYGDLIVATEVVEHLADPHSFVAGLPGRHIVLSSPCNEDSSNHYEHHAWAWDIDGYARMVEGCGWSVVEHRSCSAGFQVVHAIRSSRDREPRMPVPEMRVAVSG